MNKMTVIAALATLAGAGVLQAQNAQQPQQPRQHAEDGRGPGGRRGGGMDRMLLKGITLSDAQKAKLQELHQAERAKMQANGQRGQNSEFQAIRDARQKGDTATANRLMQEARARMEARRDEQFKAIRGLLTPDQATQFDANVAEMKQHQGERRGRSFGGHGAGHQGAARPNTNGR